MDIRELGFSTYLALLSFLAKAFINSLVENLRRHNIAFSVRIVRSITALLRSLVPSLRPYLLSFIRSVAAGMGNMILRHELVELSTSVDHFAEKSSIVSAL